MASELAALVGRNIALAREAHAERFNQRQLAEAIRKLDPQVAANNTTVSEWERGLRRPNDRYLKLIAAVLDRPVDWFLRDHGASEETPDVLGALNGDIEDRLARIEDQVREIRDCVVDDGDGGGLVAGVAVRLLLAAGWLPPQADDPPENPEEDDEQQSA